MDTPTCTNVHVHGRVNVYCITLRHACVCTAASAEQAATAERDGAQAAAPADDGSLVAELRAQIAQLQQELHVHMIRMRARACACANVHVHAHALMLTQAYALE